MLTGEVVFAASVGGAQIEGNLDLSRKYYALQSSSWSGGGNWHAYQVFDGSISTPWRSDNGDLLGSYVGRSYRTPISLAEVRITAPATSIANTWMPLGFDLQRSNDGGITWTTVQSFTTPGTWTLGETRSFAVGGALPALPITYLVSGGALPPGLALSSSTGELHGTCTAAGTYTFTITATDTVQATSKVFSMHVVAGGAGVLNVAY